MKNFLFYAIAAAIGLLLYAVSPADWTPPYSVEVSGARISYSPSQGTTRNGDVSIWMEGKKLFVKYPQGKEVYVNGVRCFPRRVEEGKSLCEISVVRKAKLAGAILGFAATLFALSSRVNYVITSLFILVLVPVLGVLKTSTALSSLSSGVIMIFLAGSAFELAMKKTALDRRLAIALLGRARGKYSLLFITILVSSLLSAVMSNTAATYVMMPILLSFVVGEASEAILLVLVASTAIGGSLTLIGTPPNLVVSSFIKDMLGKEMDFSRWLAFGFPTWLVGLGVVFILGALFMKRAGSFNVEKEELPGDKKWMGALAIILVTVVLWSTSKITGVSSAATALLAILLFFLSGIFEGSDIFKLRWDLVLLFGGGLTLGKALMESGWADWVVGRVPLPRNDLELFAFLTALLLIGTVFSSHTSAAAFIGPVMIPLGMGISRFWGASPESFGILMVVLATLSINCAMALPISTPPSAVVFSSGKVRVSRLAAFGLIFGIAMNAALVFFLKNLWMKAL